LITAKVLPLEKATKNLSKAEKLLSKARHNFDLEYKKEQEKYLKVLKKAKKRLESKYNIRELGLAHEVALEVFLNSRYENEKGKNKKP
jgi:hypothetical protein